MFRTGKVWHITAIVKEDKVSKLINKLYELGICELKESSIDLAPQYSYEFVKNIDELQNRFNAIVDPLEEYKEIPEPISLVKGFIYPEAPKKHESVLYSTEELIEEVNYHLSLIEPKILEKLEKLNQIKEKIQENGFMISNLRLMPIIETNVLESSDNIKVFSGLIANTSLDKLKEEIKEKAVIGVEQKNKTLSFVCVFCNSEESTEVEKILHTVGFQSLSFIHTHKKPGDIIANIEAENKKLNKEKQKIEVFLRKTQKLYEKKFQLLGEELTIAKNKIVTLRKFKAANTFSVLEAWVPNKDIEKFNNTIKETSKQYYLEAVEKNDAPTVFNNKGLIKPFEMLTELYSPPKYKGFDPTPILAITFTLFFGFMLTDAAYGLILITLGWLIFRGIGKFNEGAKKFSTIIIIFGISTTIMGIIFGSYFGNFFQEIGIKLPIPIDAMRQVMLVLSISLAIGSLHLIAGLISGFYENITKKNYKEAIVRQGIWLVFITSLVLFLLQQSTLGLIFLFLSVILQLVFNFLDGGPISSVLSLFSFSGFIGDLFSYARLMALAIGTAGIALAVNFMVFMVIDLIPWLGWPIAIIVFIIGHTFNIAMNGLGAFIHSTRLHFLEFFTKFYDGGGRSYKPFLAERKITYIKQEGGS